MLMKDWACAGVVYLAWGSEASPMKAVPRTIMGVVVLVMVGCWVAVVLAGADYIR